MNEGASPYKNIPQSEAVVLWQALDRASKGAVFRDATIQFRQLADEIWAVQDLGSVIPQKQDS